MIDKVTPSRETYMDDMGCGILIICANKKINKDLFSISGVELCNSCLSCPSSTWANERYTQSLVLEGNEKYNNLEIM